MLHPNPDLWKELPQEERDLIRQMAPFCALGNPLAVASMEKFYRAASELQPARLYYGAFVQDDLARLLLGRYHLHGWFLFHKDPALATDLLMRARLSKNPAIAQGADRELMVASVKITRDFSLSFDILKEYSGSSAHLVVPPSVRTIGPQAFQRNASLESVILPGCLEVIAAQAFAGCKNLRIIHLPDTVWRIEPQAFQDCAALEKIVLPKGLTHLGQGAFSGCKNLKSIDLPGNISNVEDSVFMDSGLTEAVLRPGVRSIGPYAFSGCPLETVTLPESMDFIGAHAFHGCHKLTQVLWKGGRHFVAEYTIKRGNDPFRNAAHFHYDFNTNHILSHHGDPEPIRTSPHLPPRDLNRETYPVPQTGSTDGFIGIT